MSVERESNCLWAAVKRPIYNNSLSTLKNAVRFSCLAAFNTGYSFFLISSASFGKSSEIPRLRPFVRFLMNDWTNSSSWKLESLTIIGRGLEFVVSEDTRRADTLCTVLNWILSSSFLGIFKSVRKNFHNKSLVSSFDSCSRSFIPQNFKLPLGLWHSNLIWRRCNLASSRWTRWSEASVVFSGAPNHCFL